MKIVTGILVFACLALGQKYAVPRSLPRFRETASMNMGTVAYEDQEIKAAASTAAGGQQEELFKLKSAIIQIKGDIVRKSNDLQGEAQWVAAVKGIITGFKDKITNVKAAITTKKTTLKTLLKKKRQLENLLLQI